MASRPRGAQQISVFLSIDGHSARLQMTAAERAALQRRLQPYLDRARPVGYRRTAPPQQHEEHVDRAHAAVRGARLAGLLGSNGRTPSPTTAPRQSADPELDKLVAAAAGLFERALADETRATYRRRWRAYTAWCASQGLNALPSSTGTVALYLADQARCQPAPSLTTLRGTVAAINRVHIEAGHAAPRDDPAMALLMRGLSRSVPRRTRPDKISALRIEDLRAVCRSMAAPDGRALRDAAVLRLLSVGLSQAECARLRWSDITVGPAAVTVATRRPDGTLSRTVRLSTRRIATRPAAAAIRAWRAVAGTLPDPFFTSIDRFGQRGGTALGERAVLHMIRARHTAYGVSVPDDGVDEALADTLGQPANDALRDRAALLLGFAGAFRRSELAALRWSDLRLHPDGLVVHLRRSKTDPLGYGRDVGIPYGRHTLTCPVTAAQTWRKRMRSQLSTAWHDELPVIPHLRRTGHIDMVAISPEGVTMLIKRRAATAGVAGRWGGRSLRAGFISTAADLEVPLESVAAQSRHASLDSLILYIRREDPFRRNAADRVGL